MRSKASVGEIQGKIFGNPRMKESATFQNNPAESLRVPQKSPSGKPLVRLFILFLMAAGVIFLSMTLALYLRGEKSPGPSSAPIEAQPPLPGVVAEQFLLGNRVCVERCAQADREAADAALASLEEWFDEKSEHVDELVDELFSLNSRAKMIYLFARRGGRLETYLEERTGAHLGSPGKLAGAVAARNQALMSQMEKNHGELLRKLESDLVPLVNGYTGLDRSRAEFSQDFRASFDQTLKRILPLSVGTQAGVEALCLALDVYVARALAVRLAQGMATRALVSGGATLAAEAGVAEVSTILAPYTGGISLVVGTVIAIGIDYTCNEIAKNQAEKKIRASFQAWRDSTLASYRNQLQKGIREFQQTRFSALKQSLAKEMTR